MTDTPAIRTISEDDDWRVIEGRAIPWGGPFNGRDSYGTYFSARTDLGDLEPPTKLWYNHGFDSDFGFSSIGRVTAFRTEDDGVWVQAQISKRHKYYAERVAPLLDHPDGPQVGFSAGSAEHSYRIDAKSGEVLTYPVHEISLTPTEANPWAAIAARTAEAITILEAVRRDYDPAVGGGVDRDQIPAEDFAGPNRSFPIVTPDDVADAAASIGRAKGNKTEIRSQIIAIAQRKGEAFAQKLPKEWSGAPEAERSGEPTEDELDELAVRAGQRNSRKDLTRINAIRLHAAAIAQAVTELMSPETADAMVPDTDRKRPAPTTPPLPATPAQPPQASQPAPARSAEDLTVVTITERQPDAAAVRAELMSRAERAGRKAAKGMTGR